MKKLSYIVAILLLPFLSMAQGLELTDDTVFKNVEGKTISLDDFQAMINSGDYSIDPKMDANGNVIEVGLIKLTEEDKIMATRLVDVKNEAEGHPITPFRVSTIDGKSYDSENQKGKVTVLKFWFKECGPCLAEMPGLNKLVTAYENNEDVNFVAFGLDTKSDIQEFLKKQPFKYDIVASSEPIRASMNINGFPTHIVVDKNGIVSDYLQGGHINIEQKLGNAIEVALGHHVTSSSSALQPAEISENGEAIGFIIEPSTTIKDESGSEIDFDTFMKLMNTGDYVPEPAKTQSGNDYIILKKKS